MSNYPPGVTDNDSYFDMPSVHDDEDEFDEETMCSGFVDLGIRCGKPITRKMVGPYKTDCCSDCAADFVKQGYREVKGDEEKPPLG